MDQDTKEPINPDYARIMPIPKVETSQAQVGMPADMKTDARIMQKPIAPTTITPPIMETPSIANQPTITMEKTSLIPQAETQVTENPTPETPATPKKPWWKLW